MLVLHTSDWHVGRTTYNKSRASDIDVTLNEIITLAKETHPDVIIHSGDLLDHSRVAHAEIERVVDALVELSAVATTVVVAGNHDSPTLFRVFERLHHGRRLHFITQPLGQDETYLSLPGQDGTTLRLGALPFVNAHKSIDVFDDPDHWAGDYRRRVGMIQSAIATGLNAGLDPRRDVTVFAAHLYVTGAGLAGSERAGHVTDEYSTDLADMPTVDYAAFGHIHQPQELPGPVTGRYAGSPIPLDFGELGQVKSTALVTLRPGTAPDIEMVPLSGGRALHRFNGTLTDLQRQADQIGDALCLVTVHSDTHDPLLSERVHELLPRATILQVTQTLVDGTTSPLVVEPGMSVPHVGILEHFSDYLASNSTKLASSNDVKAALAELLAATEEEREPVFPQEALLTSHTCAEEHS